MTAKSELAALNNHVVALEAIIDDVLSALIITHPAKREIVAGLRKYLPPHSNSVLAAAASSAAENLLEVIAQREKTRS